MLEQEQVVITRIFVNPALERISVGVRDPAKPTNVQRHAIRPYLVIGQHQR
jgi:hypothetical protein